jgi:hypothetical protein
VQGKAVAVEDEYKYLGLMFGTGRVLLSTKLEKTAARKGAAALAAVYGIVPFSAHTVQPISEDEIVQSCSPANLLYACEVWGTKSIQHFYLVLASGG